MPAADEVFIVTGIPGAGKSTTARALAATFDRGVHLEADVLSFEFVVSGLADPFGDDDDRAEWSRQMSLRRRLQGVLAREYVDAGFVVVIDDVITHRSVLEEVVRSLEPRAASLVVLAPPLTVVAARDAGRDKHVYDAWRHLDDELRSELEGVGLWIEDPDLTVDAVVQRILDGSNAAGF